MIVNRKEGANRESPYEPVATAVPVLQNNHGPDVAVIPAPILSDGNAVPPQLSHFPDPYFEGRPEIVTSFAFDREGMYRRSQCHQVTAWLPWFVFAALILGFKSGHVSLFFMVLMLYGLFFDYMNGLRRVWVDSMHLGVTETSIVFEQEQRRTWYGSARATRLELAFADYFFFHELQDGNSVACYSCADSVNIYCKPLTYVWSFHGLYDAPEFVAYLLERGMETITREKVNALAAAKARGEDLTRYDHLSQREVPNACV